MRQKYIGKGVEVTNQLTGNQKAAEIFEIPERGAVCKTHCSSTSAPNP